MEEGEVGREEAAALKTLEEMVHCWKKKGCCLTTLDCWYDRFSVTCQSGLLAFDRSSALNSHLARQVASQIALEESDSIRLTEQCNVASVIDAR